MMYYVYLLKSKENNQTYVGFSSNLKNRLHDHNSGKVKATKAYKPWTLIYYESFRDIKDARIREINLKQHRPKSDLLKRLKRSLKL